MFWVPTCGTAVDQRTAGPVCKGKQGLVGITGWQPGAPMALASPATRLQAHSARSIAAKLVTSAPASGDPPAPAWSCCCGSMRRGTRLGSLLWSSVNNLHRLPCFMARAT